MKMFSRKVALVALTLSPVLVKASDAFAVDFSTVISDIGTLSVAVVGVLVAFKGAQYIWRALRGA